MPGTALEARSQQQTKQTKALSLEELTFKERETDRQTHTATVHQMMINDMERNEVRGGLVNARAGRHLAQEGLPAERHLSGTLEEGRWGPLHRKPGGAHCRQKEQTCKGPEAGMWDQRCRGGADGRS